MNSVERVKLLCKERGIAISRLEKKLGFANGYIGQLRKGTFPADRLAMIAEYFGVSSEYLRTGEQKEYYISEETAQVAQEIFENKELRLLFDAARDANPDDLKTTRDMLMALKKKEKKIEE